MTQSYEGYIWLGTTSGLVRFDGVKFKTFTKQNTPALTNDRIISLYIARDNVLWIGTDGGGLCSYKKGNWEKYTTKEGLSNNRVRAITGDWQGNLWVGTGYGLCRLYLNSFETFTTKDGLYDNIINALTVDIWGNLWIGTLRGGLARYTEGVIFVYDYNKGLLNSSVNCLFADHIGNIWIGTMEGLFYLEQREGIVKAISGTSYTPVTSIIEDKQDALLIGTMADGLKRIINGSDCWYSSENSFADDYIHDLLIDREENLFIGTNASGLVQVKQTRIKNITRENGIPENNIYSIIQDHKGTFWIGTRNSGLCKMINNKVVRIYNKKSGLSSNRISVIFEDNMDNLWIGTLGGGVNRLQNGILTTMTAEHGLSSNNITDITQDNSGTLWIGTDKGLNIVYGKKISIFQHHNQLINPYIRTLLVGRDGGLYIGCKDGLYKLSGDYLFKILPERQDPEIDVIHLYEDSNRTLWLGTNGSGLKRLLQGNITSCTTRNGLPDNYIFSITEDEENNMWFSSYKGVFRINKKELNDFLDTRRFFLHPIWFDEKDGMASRLCSEAGKTSICKSKSGKLYYPTARGISVIEPKNIVSKSAPPKIIIEDIIVDNVSVIKKDKISLSHRCERVEIHFTAIDFTAPEKLRFRYKLEGHDSDFTALFQNNRRIAEYNNLNPGKYRFIVKARNNVGFWNEKGAVLEFSIRTPLYKRALFYIILIIFSFLMTGAVFLFRTKKRIKKQQEKYKTSTLDPEIAKQTIPKLLRLMEEQKLYLNPNLTLQELSRRLNIHYNHLSRIINERFGLSFNDFINKYRIEEVKIRLSDPGKKKKSILEIMYDTGFYSKSAFNTAFKKFTGKTPSEYRKNQ